MKVGYLGLGAMGGCLAEHLAAVHDLIVYDINPASTAHLRQCGASVATSARHLAQVADVVVLCLPRSSDVEAILFGAGGVEHDLRPGTLVIDQTSGIPRMTAGFAERLSGRDILFMDAPVSGGIPAARNRAVTVLASGPEVAWQLGEPVLRSLSTKVIRCGAKVGDGQVLKLVTNGIGACYRLATLELVALGRRFGIPLPDLVRALNGGQGANFTSRNMLVGLVEGRSTTNFAMALMVKDLNGVLGLGAEVRLAMPLTGTARGLMQSAIGLFGPEVRLDDVVPLIEKLSAVRFTGDARNEDEITLPDHVSAKDMLTALSGAVAACNSVAVVEGVNVGLALGLDIRDIGQVIEAGSAWCEIAGPLLDSMTRAPIRLADLAAERVALEVTGDLAVRAGLPFIMPGIALSRFRAP